MATSATPNEIKATFRNCRIIGRRFRLAHVHFGSDPVTGRLSIQVLDPTGDVCSSGTTVQLGLTAKKK